jgi:aminoglycoside phosphotransferase (APT) family kinase protein
MASTRDRPLRYCPVCLAEGCRVTDDFGVPEWTGPPTWFHGDLHPANVLAFDGWVSAIIDFNHAGAGAPACDTMIAWTMLSDVERPVFVPGCRSTIQRRAGAGWALSLGVAAVGPADLLTKVGNVLWML